MNIDAAAITRVGITHRRAITTTRNSYGLTHKNQVGVDNAIVAHNRFSANPILHGNAVQRLTGTDVMDIASTLLWGRSQSSLTE